MKDAIIEKALKDAPAHGWSMAALRRAAQDLGHKPQMVDALFGSLSDANRAVSDIFDTRMMDHLKNIDIENMRVRDRIATAVRTRLDLMAPYKDGLKLVCPHPTRAAKPLWRSADRIWVWAGDTATDYNHYTKRALLSGVMASTMLFWFQDNSPRHTATGDFLDRRINNVLIIGKFLGTLTKKKAA